MPDFEVGDLIKYSQEWLNACLGNTGRTKYAALVGEVIAVKEESIIVKWATLKTLVSLYFKWLEPELDPDCCVCLGSCCEDIHAATVRVHKWFREFVTLSLDKKIVPGKVHVPEDS